MARDLRPVERRPSSGMLAALRYAADLGDRKRSEPWVRGPRERRAPSRQGRACWRRGWADEYRVTPNGQPYYVLNDAGRAVLQRRTP